MKWNGWFFYIETSPLLLRMCPSFPLTLMYNTVLLYPWLIPSADGERPKSPPSSKPQNVTKAVLVFAIIGQAVS